MQMQKIKSFLICMAIVFLAAYIGSIMTSDKVNSGWYNSIKPSITPPNFVFPVVWAILFFLIGLSMYFAWNSGIKHRKAVIIVFAINLVLNILWSFFYFKMQNPVLGFIDIIAILASIIAMISVLWKIDKKASYLLLPYLLWVAFASVLNFLSMHL